MAPGFLNVRQSLLSHQMKTSNPTAIMIKIRNVRNEKSTPPSSEPPPLPSQTDPRLKFVKFVPGTIETGAGKDTSTPISFHNRVDSSAQVLEDLFNSARRINHLKTIGVDHLVKLR
jgi:hypothetical protein